MARSLIDELTFWLFRVTGNDPLTTPGGKPFGMVMTPGASARLPIGLLLAANTAPLLEPATTRGDGDDAPNLRLGLNANWRKKPIPKVSLHR